ncbi:hypothetical protein HK097_003976 [Rhizophlyctis rosea]|uniref:Outer dense fiber protein 3 n=1 Tax=Rhizophlyctis rosea TaxID=64517 RepID=A0AAD5SFN8_9FUNG|nr:hypothetical protein HK097_003976 [Rhizophlyctis rosea]
MPASADPAKLPKLPAGSADVVRPAETKEIPIAARLKGPGPAAYTLPTTIGLTAKTGKRAPAYSFGIKITGPKAVSETPGPNAFFPQTTRTGASKGPAFSLQGGYKKERAASAGSDRDGKQGDEPEPLVDGDTPGPGKYNPTYISAKEPRAPAYSMGGRRSSDKQNGNPGPAEYAINSTVGLHPAITVPAAPAYTIKPPRPMKLESFSPGPAAYAALSPSKIKPAAPAYSLGSRWQHPVGETFEASADGEIVVATTPGPGHYTPDIHHSKQGAPQYTFRNKHSEYELFVPDTTEGEFII